MKRNCTTYRNCRLQSSNAVKYTNAGLYNTLSYSVSIYLSIYLSLSGVSVDVSSVLVGRKKQGCKRFQFGVTKKCKYVTEDVCGKINSVNVIFGVIWIEYRIVYCKKSIVELQVN